MAGMDDLRRKFLSAYDQGEGHTGRTHAGTFCGECGWAQKISRSNLAARPEQCLTIRDFITCLEWKRKQVVAWVESTRSDAG